MVFVAGLSIHKKEYFSVHIATIDSTHNDFNVCAVCRQKRYAESYLFQKREELKASGKCQTSSLRFERALNSTPHCP